MDGAEEALRGDDFAGALDRQSEAIEALREGMRDLADQMASGRPAAARPGGSGPRRGRTPTATATPWAAKRAGTDGSAPTRNSTQSEDVYRRAREILEEIRRRSGEQARPDEELDYLRRLLDRF